MSIQAMLDAEADNLYDRRSNREFFYHHDDLGSADRERVDVNAALAIAELNAKTTELLLSLFTEEERKVAEEQHEKETKRKRETEELRESLQRHGLEETLKRRRILDRLLDSDDEASSSTS